MRKIEEIENFLRETPVFYLATIDENRPKCRPIGFHLLRGAHIYFGVGTFKDVYKQLMKIRMRKSAPVKERGFCGTMEERCLRQTTQSQKLCWKILPTCKKSTTSKRGTGLAFSTSKKQRRSFTGWRSWKA